MLFNIIEPSYSFIIGVTKLMVTGTSLTSSRDALRLSRLYPGVLYATTGKHKYYLYINTNQVYYTKLVESNHTQN